MNRILISQVQLNGKPCDILIEGSQIAKIVPKIEAENISKTIDGRDKAVISSFANTHTHSAMTLFRGLGEDMPLMKWLNECIWPYEKHLDEEAVYWGARLACVEMIKSGTTVFNDMYWHVPACVKAAEEMGLKSVQGYCWIDHFEDARVEKHKRDLPALHALSRSWNADLTKFSVAPHAIYTVSDEGWRWMAAYAREHGLMLHIHLEESQTEHEWVQTEYDKSVTRYLYDLGVLGPNVVAAHSVWLSDEDIQILGDHGVSAVHNPNSNFKLASGYKFKYNELRDAGVRVCLGTDGCASSNNLDMVEAMKNAAMMQKVWRRDPAAMPLNELMEVASRHGYEAMGFAGGRIEEGLPADLALIDLLQPAFVPSHNFHASLIYAAHGDAVDTLLCNGRILMENRQVPEEKYIMRQVQETACRLLKTETNKNI
jgi:Cytosine deaminase and related metal-dependent hydrolases